MTTGTTFYMEPNTGAVGPMEEWEAAFSDRPDKDQTWGDWGGESLIEVIANSEDDPGYDSDYGQDWRPKHPAPGIS